jgi:glycosyltransferase involved in cell wall biosynthesis
VEDKKIKVLMGMDAYLPHIDGVVSCMHNYCLTLYQKIDLTAIGPKHGKAVVDVPYRLLRCKSINLLVENQHYGVAKWDKKIKKILNETDLDIIHLHSPFGMMSFSYNIAKKKNIPIIATFHTNFRPIFKKVFKSGIITEMLVRYVGKHYNKLDEIFVCSPQIAEQARSFGYTGKISYVPFGTDFAKAENCAELIAAANSELGIKEDETVFIYVGRLEDLKRIDFILDSLKILKDRGAKFRFYICGKGMHAEKLKRYSKKLGFTDGEVLFTGFIAREKFPLLYARADLLLFPSLYDNFGLVKVEAAAFSTAGVFIRDSAAGYGITDGLNGFLSENDTAAFADKIAEAVADKQKLRQIGINASNDIYYSWAQCADILIEKYKETIDEHKKRSRGTEQGSAEKND